MSGLTANHEVIEPTPEPTPDVTPDAPKADGAGS